MNIQQQQQQKSRSQRIQIGCCLSERIIKENKAKKKEKRIQFSLSDVNGNYRFLWSLRPKPAE